MQFQADALGIEIERPVILDATAQGAAFGAGLTVGFWDNYQDLVASRGVERIFSPEEGASSAQANYGIWKRAVERAKNWIE